MPIDSLYSASDELLPPYNRLNTPSFASLAAQRRAAGDGFTHLGSVIGSTLAGGGARDLRGQQVFQQAATGSARLQDILLQARQRRDAEIGRQAAAADATAKGHPEIANAILNSPNAASAATAALGIQKYGNIGDLMTQAKGDSPDLNRLNRELMVLHGQPSQLTKVEGQNVLNPMVTPDTQTVAPTDIGEAMIGTQQATAGERNAQAGAANALATLRAGPQSAAFNALADQREAKTGAPTALGGVGLKPSKLTVPEMTTALGGEPNARGVRHIDPAKLRQFNTLQQGMIEAGDPNASNSQYVLDRFENSYGNDPEDVPPGTLDIPTDAQAGFDYAAKHGGRVPVTTQPAVVPNPKGVATPKSKADFDALPSGAVYIDPGDGTTRRKP